MREHIKHTMIDVDSSGVGECKLNVRTGRIQYGVGLLSVGDGNYGIGCSMVYAPNAEYSFGVQTNVGSGWKLNLQEYMWRERVQAK